ncbi:MAG: DNA internalization-related competence protein ComEC/Rec2 [Gammaproteobacteria bacterium]
MPGGGGGGVQGRGWQWGRLHWVAALGLAPLSLLFFQQQPLLAPLANLLAVPWVSLLVVPLVLAGVSLLVILPPLGGSLLVLAATLLSWLWTVLAWLATLPLGQWFQAPPLWAVLAALPGIGLLLSPRGLPGRWTGVWWLLPLFLVTPARPPEQTLWFTLLDVGQGLAAVARTRDHVLVYDSGPRFSERFDAGAAVIVPFLRQQGIHHVDMLVLGHGDNDHIGGTASLLRGISVGRVISSVPDKVPWRQATHCRAGQAWRWNGVVFRMLHPLPDRGFLGNDASCVLQISTARRGILLTGDIEYRAEQALVRRYGEQLRAQVLVVPHHGSRTSSSALFLDAVAPDYALFPVGYRNRYGFPAAAVLERYRSRDIRLLDSARHGAIRFVLDARGGLSVPAAYRVTARRYWHGG